MLNFKTELCEEFKLLDKYLLLVADNKDPLIREVAQYVITTTGKRLRPAMVFLSGKSLGGDIDKLAKVAASLELIHTATLIHDDVVDSAETRRGKPTVSAKWGREVAVLIADYLFSNSFMLALEVLKPEILLTLTKVTNKMCEGEFFQLQKKGTYFSPEEYYQIIESKTASLFSACPVLGAIASDAESEIVKSFSDFGLFFGMAFQITDDILDYTGSLEKTGKEPGNDLKDGKQTLPLIYSLSIASPEDRAGIIKCFENGRDFNTISTYINKYNGIEFAREKAGEYSAKSISQMKSIPKNKYSQMLYDIAASVISREC